MSHEWITQAKCATTDPELYYATGHYDSGYATTEKTREAARALCEGCPVIQECLRASLADPDEAAYGVRGGLTGRDRINLIRKAKRQAPLPTKPIINSGDKCRSGKHEITGTESVYIRPSGDRQCKACARERERATRRAKREQQATS